MATTEQKVGATPSLKAVSLDDIPEIQRAGKASRVVEEFLASNMQAAEVEDHSKTFATSLKRYIKNSGAAVEVLNRKGNIYLRLTEDGEGEVNEDI